MAAATFQLSRCLLLFCTMSIFAVGEFDLEKLLSPAMTPEDASLFHNVETLASDPSAEPTASPTTEPTAEPTSYLAEFVYFEAGLSLSNATSSVLDGAATTVLEESVATSMGLPTSAVDLLSYQATIVTAATARLEVKSEDYDHAAYSALSSWEQLQQGFHRGFLRSSLLLAKTGSSVGRRTGAEDDLQEQQRRRLASTSYDILANMGVKATLADFPQYNGNVTALWVALADRLTAAAGDNSLAQLIVANSRAANSLTFAYVDGVVVTSISAPSAEFFPSAAPTGPPVQPQPQRSSPPLEPGEIAGAIIALMVGLGLVVLAVYYFCVKRRSKRPDDAIVLYKPYDAPTRTAQVPEVAPSTSATEAMTTEGKVTTNNTTTITSRSVSGGGARRPVGQVNEFDDAGPREVVLEL